ncbi:hypothetical protein AB0M48_30145 [Lentzea sp. NPDC051208]|uniref:hypothetical protein n=1 Tax=Lentzea sp. NPDC051208 TaxID=3154642 RepID=UPI003416C0DA
MPGAGWALRLALVELFCGKEKLMVPKTTIEPTGRVRAMLRAVRAGRCELSGGTEPDLFVDGVPFCDQPMAHVVVNAGLIEAERPVALCDRACARLTPAGMALMGEHTEFSAAA